jgi:hypothetical protein
MEGTPVGAEMGEIMRPIELVRIRETGLRRRLISAKPILSVSPQDRR